MKANEGDRQNHGCEMAETDLEIPAAGNVSFAIVKARDERLEAFDLVERRQTLDCPN